MWIVSSSVGAVRIGIIVVAAAVKEMTVSLVFVLRRFEQLFSNLFGDIYALARDVASSLSKVASLSDIGVGWYFAQI